MGIAFNSPLIQVRTEPRKARWPAELSFLSVEPSHVSVITLKEAENGDGRILRLFESSGKACTAVVKSERKIKEAYEIDPLERMSSQRRLELRTDGRLSVKIGAYEVTSLLIHYH
jgi:alpha-mannosidase